MFLPILAANFIEQSVRSFTARSTRREAACRHRFPPVLLAPLAPYALSYHIFSYLSAQKYARAALAEDILLT